MKLAPLPTRLKRLELSRSGGTLTSECASGFASASTHLAARFIYVNSMNIDQDLAKIALQEERLQFKYFDSDAAWAIGTALRAAAEKRRVAVAVDIQLHGHQLFSCSMQGTTLDNLDWIRRKRNCVMHFHRSSYAIGLELSRAPAASPWAGLDPKEFATHGGCFPILLAATGCVGTITVSGLPQREDHALVVSVLQDYLNLAGEDLALDSSSAL